MQKLDKLAYEMDYEGRSASRALVLGVAVAFVIACLIAFCCSGCATIVEKSIQELDRQAKKWEEKQNKLPPVVIPESDTSEEPTVAESATVDAVAFSSFQWKYGVFDGARATPDAPQISNLSVQRNGMSIRWDVDLKSWGLSHGDAGALACLFCRVDGVWRGGKFDWISSSRSTRDFNNIHSGYNGWSASDFNRAEAYAFVVVSANGARRSNVVVTGK